MLCSLHISNYALIDRIDLKLHPSLNIITGETGGGKSIMLGALSLLLGGRADSRSIRQSDRKSVIEAVFDVKGNDALKSICVENDIDWDDDRMILRREITPSGRSRGFINDTPVTVERLREAGYRLVDIHSQHQNQLLTGPAFQLDIIDSLADNKARLEQYSGLFASYRAAVHKLKATKAAIARDKENADFMQYQLQRLEELDLQPDELKNLEADREQLTSAAVTRESLDDALTALSAGEGNAMSMVAKAIDAISDVADLFSENEDLLNRLETVNVELGDITDAIERKASAFPAEASSDLEAIDSRIARITAVMNRHNVDDSNSLMEIASRLRLRLQRLEDSQNVVAECEAQARAAKKAAMDVANLISNARKAAAEEFGTMLRETAVPLGMKNLVCDIAVEPSDMSVTGIDRVEFRFAFNKNQTPLPVGAAASGGEISRLMISIKSIIARRMALPSIIFDEVDTGVSGDVADRMGRMMREIGDKIQVIAITHLPQVAAKGTHHFKVFKHDTDISTVTHVEELTPDERIGEIALMLSGDASDSAARGAAMALLASTPE